MAREVLTGPDGRATGVSYIDKRSSEEVQVRGKVVVLAASACETARLLLNSRSSQFPHGVANSSGMVGRYVMDSVMSDVTGWIPSMMNLPPHNEDGVGGMHLFMPWWNYQEQLQGKLPFSRGYHVEIGGGWRGMPAPGLLTGSETLLGGGYGKALKQRSRSLYGSLVGFHGRGEMIPNPLSYCEIDKNTVDKWGIPVLKFRFQWSDQEIHMACHMQETFQQIVATMGGKVIESYAADQQWGISAGGVGFHEVGGARMGNDPKTSALNSHCQAWDCKNLFVTDGAPFVSLSDKNPTLTILALAWRTSEYIAAQVRTQSV